MPIYGWVAIIGITAILAILFISCAKYKLMSTDL